MKEFPDINFFIDPICHDGGTSIESVRYFAYCFEEQRKKSIRHSLFGMMKRQSKDYPVYKVKNFYSTFWYDRQKVIKSSA